MRLLATAIACMMIGFMIGLDMAEQNVHIQEIVWIDKPDTLINLGDAWDITCEMSRDLVSY